MKVNINNKILLIDDDIEMHPMFPEHSIFLDGKKLDISNKNSRKVWKYLSDIYFGNIK